MDEHLKEPAPRDPVVNVSVNVADIERSADFYLNVLKLNKFDEVKGEGKDSSLTVGTSDGMAKLVLVEREGKKVWNFLDISVSSFQVC